MTHERWNCEELSGMALAKSSRSTRSTVMAWYEGPEMAQQQPVTNVSTRIIQTSEGLLMTPVQTSVARTSADAPAHACVYMSRRLRSTRSAMTPPTSVSRSPGAVAMNVSTPSHVPEFVSCRTSQDCATDCIHVPAFDKNAPAQNRRKLRCASARNIPEARPACAACVSVPAVAIGLAMSARKRNNARRRARVFRARAAAPHLRCLRRVETARSEDDPRESVGERGGGAETAPTPRAPAG